tara:strand:+ start:525 stop:2225 length:1701 start_codon:yes stop_codon:yes gene_type:complete
MSFKLKSFDEWTSDIFDKKTVSNVINLKKVNQNDFDDSFYKNLEFGTGGMRGIMGVGPNRVNKYTFGKTTQGISNYLNNKFKNKDISVVIGRDCRNNGEDLEKIVSKVFSSNGIKVYKFKSIQPTPIVSFAIKELKCKCGIVLTASHNPKEYNGYKVYWEDGGQIVPPVDSRLTEEIDKVEYSEIKFKKNKNLIHTLDSTIEKLYVEKSLSFFNKLYSNSEKNLKIVFTSLHGTSYKLIPNLLKKTGFSELKLVDKQMIPDGNFTHAKSSNPENKLALIDAIEIAKKNNSDLVIGTDPDADRFGIVVKDFNGDFVQINGNQSMIVLTDFLLSRLQYEKTKSFIASTVVSTPMMQKIADKNKVKLILSLTGFKWIGKMINDFPSLNYICGGEESYGFLASDFVRDKDALTSSLLISGLCNELKEKNSSFFERLIDCYLKYGFYKEKLLSITEKGEKGFKKISEKINSFRDNPPNRLADDPIIKIYDYKESLLNDKLNNCSSILNFPKSNLLIFESSNGTRVAVRPSGTEPKIKYYFSVNANLDTKNDFKIKDELLNKKINLLIEEFI